MFNDVCAQYIRVRSFGDKGSVQFIEKLENEDNLIAQSFLMVMHKCGFGCLANQRKASEFALRCLPPLAEIALGESPEQHSTFPHSVYTVSMPCVCSGDWVSKETTACTTLCCH